MARGTDDWPPPVQVVDLVTGEPCSDLASYPFRYWQGAGVLLENTPVICGGIKGYQSDQCRFYDKASNTWELLAYMVTPRVYFGAAIFKGALWVTGGKKSNIGTETTEIIAPDGTVTAGPTLPTRRYAHCMVVLNNNEFMMVGGNCGPARNSRTYNATSGTFTDGPSTLHDRYYAPCSIFQSKFHNDRQVVLVAGGEDDPGTAELLDFSQENAQWVEGMNFTGIFQDLGV